MPDQRKVTVREWYAEGHARYGQNQDDWKFVCPACKHPQTVREMKAAGVPEASIAFSCIGRWIERSTEAFDKKPGPCTYAGGGLFKLNPVTVQLPDGKEHSVFEWADPPPEPPTSNTCTCGHAVEEHAPTAEYPGSTSCAECACIAFEADHG